MHLIGSSSEVKLTNYASYAKLINYAKITQTNLRIKSKSNIISVVIVNKA